MAADLGTRLAFYYAQALAEPIVYTLLTPSDQQGELLLQPSLLLAHELAYDHDLSVFDAPSHPLLHSEAIGHLARLTAWLHHQAVHEITSLENEVQYAQDVFSGRQHLSRRRAVLGLLGLSATTLWGLEHIAAFSQVGVLLLAGVDTANTIYQMAPLLKRFWNHAAHPSQRILLETNQEILQEAGGLGLSVLFPLLKNLILPVGATLINPFLGLAVTAGVLLAEHLASNEVKAISGPLALSLTEAEDTLRGDSALLHAVSQVEENAVQRQLAHRSLPMLELENAWRLQGAAVLPLPSEIPGLELSFVSSPEWTWPHVLLAHFTPSCAPTYTRLKRVFEAARQESAPAIFFTGIEFASTIDNDLSELKEQFHLQVRVLDNESVARELSLSPSLPTQPDFLSPDTYASLTAPSLYALL